MQLIELPDDEAHIRWVQLDQAHHPEDVARYRSLMSSDEADRQARFMFESGRHEYLLTRALARTTLSLYTGVDPKDFRFDKNEHGCPFVSAPKLEVPLDFNLSNTRGLVAIIVGRRAVGVDVEWMDRRTETTSVADRFFSPFEVEALKRLPAEQQRDRFFRYWTLKESYIKARKMGLAIPLRNFSFLLDQGGEIGIAIEAVENDDPKSWQFMERIPNEGHRLAAAARRGERPLKFRFEQIVP